MKFAIAVLLGVWSASAAAQDSPVGLWKTVDDTTGREKGLVRIVAENGALSGRIEGTLDPNGPKHRTCDQCSDDRKGQPLLGMTIVRGVRPSSNEAGLWEGGDILDPDSGKVYRVRLRLLQDGKALEVRGYIGIALLGRTQIWQRVQ